MKCWSTLSKNSADTESKFVQDATRVLSPYMTESLWENLMKTNSHVNFELISKEDQQHGNTVLFEVPIVVSIGTGASITVDGKTVEESKKGIQTFLFNGAFHDSSLVKRIILVRVCGSSAALTK